MVCEQIAQSEMGLGLVCGTMVLNIYLKSHLKLLVIVHLDSFHSSTTIASCKQ